VALCRPPALTNERAQAEAACRVVLKLKSPLAQRDHAPGHVAAGFHAAGGSSLIALRRLAKVRRS
jgi:hypothetical protein